MTEAEWLAATGPRPMVCHLGDGASERKLRLFVVASCRLVPDWFGERRSRHEIETGERMADGLPEDAQEAAEVAAEEARIEQAVREGMNPNWVRDGDFRLVRGLTRNCLGDARKGAETAIAAFEWCDGVRYPSGLGECVAEESMPSRQCRLLRDLFGNPFRPVAFDPAWRTPAAIRLASGMYGSRVFDRMPELADELERAGCGSAEVRDHCREPGVHVRGCWVIDRVLGRE